MKQIQMKDPQGKIRWKAVSRRSAYEAGGWIAVETDKPSKKETNKVVMDEPVTLKITDFISEPNQQIEE